MYIARVLLMSFHNTEIPFVSTLSLSTTCPYPQPFRKIRNSESIHECFQSIAKMGEKCLQAISSVVLSLGVVDDLVTSRICFESSVIIVL